MHSDVRVSLPLEVEDLDELCGVKRDNLKKRVREEEEEEGAGRWLGVWMGGGCGN